MLAMYTRFLPQRRDFVLQSADHFFIFLIVVLQSSDLFFELSDPFKFLLAALRCGDSIPEPFPFELHLFLISHVNSAHRSSAQARLFVSEGHRIAGVRAHSVRGVQITV